MSGIETLYLVVLLIVCLLLSAFFSSSETAFISLQRIRVQHLVDTKVRGAKRVARMMERPEKFLSTVLLGNNFVNTAAAALATFLAISIWGEQWGLLIATIAVTIVLLIFCETTPKTIATRHAERLSLTFVGPIEALSWLLTPFVVALSWIASGFSKLFGGTPVPRSLATEEEIRTMISVGHREGTVEEEEAEMLHKVFDFGNRPVSEVIVPRTEVVWVEKGTKLADFLNLYAQSPLSRFPVYEDNMDNVVGILSVKDIVMAQAKGTISDESVIDDLIRPAYFAPETKRISELFAEMRDKNYRMTVVVDEFGGTAGIVSLSRLVEEIVGPVGDELAAIEKEYEPINEYTFSIDGGMRIEEANEEMDLDLPEGDYETVAGFVLDLLGHIPKQGERLKYKKMKIVITEMRGMKIEKILLTKEKHAATAD
ncbi:MAG: HlyC/CorC family transporter [Dehalococcoidales bacterium]|nr:HlyC/CorC family transporter [Dehalococcoidales bacterium]